MTEDVSTHIILSGQWDWRRLNSC